MNIRKNFVRAMTCLCTLLALEACGIVNQIKHRSEEVQPVEANPLWLASLDILDFLPVKSVNAEHGLIITDYGKPPGGDTEYRATVLIVDAAIDASALKISLFTKDGPVTPDVLQGIERAILTRARELYSSPKKNSLKVQNIFDLS